MFKLATPDTTKPAMVAQIGEGAATYWSLPWSTLRNVYNAMVDVLLFRQSAARAVSGQIWIEARRISKIYHHI